MNGPDPPTSPWGEPAPAVGAPDRPPGTAGRRAGTSPSSNLAARASSLYGRRSSRKRTVQLVERTVQVRIVPRTGVLARVRAALMLAVIAVSIGVVVGGAFTLVVWGIATAIHHAAGN